jgi:hypothetical protein
MARHRLGHSKEAADALASAREWIAHGDERAIPDPYIVSPLPWYTRLELELLLREAEDQIARVPADLPADVFAPRQGRRTSPSIERLTSGRPTWFGLETGPGTRSSRPPFR